LSDLARWVVVDVLSFEAKQDPPLAYATSTGFKQYLPSPKGIRYSMTFRVVSNNKDAIAAFVGMAGISLAIPIGFGGEHKNSGVIAKMVFTVVNPSWSEMGKLIIEVEGISTTDEASPEIVVSTVPPGKPEDQSLAPVPADHDAVITPPKTEEQANIYAYEPVEMPEKRQQKPKKRKKRKKPTSTIEEPTRFIDLAE
jgi:hypothetical protein